MSPVSLVTALISFTHTPLMPFTVSDVFFRPWRTASSTLFSEDALTSMTLATVIALLQWGRHRRRNAQARPGRVKAAACGRSEEHTSELQSLMRISYAVFCLKKKKKKEIDNTYLLYNCVL